jgi:carbonic anhydrase/acetyltransferase-like protein (isoleucine patch superfamily)
VIEHGSRIDDFSILAPSVIIAGNVNIGSRTFIGMNSSVSENLEIGSGCIVGANSFVNSSLENSSTYYGTQARKVR